MNRIRDYTGFAAWFAGLGYIVLWPLTSPDLGGKPFGASIFCRDGSPSLLDLLVQFGASADAAAGLACDRIFVGGVRHRAAAVACGEAFAARGRRRRYGCVHAPRANTGASACRRGGKSPARPLRRPVKPRTHFGLRGMPH